MPGPAVIRTRFASTVSNFYYGGYHILPSCVLSSETLYANVFVSNLAAI